MTLSHYGDKSNGRTQSLALTCTMCRANDTIVSLSMNEEEIKLHNGFIVTESAVNVLYDGLLASSDDLKRWLMRGST